MGFQGVGAGPGHTDTVGGGWHRPRPDKQQRGRSRLRPRPRPAPADVTHAACVRLYVYSLEKSLASSSSTEMPLALESAPCDSHCGRARQGWLSPHATPTPPWQWSTLPVPDLGHRPLRAQRGRCPLCPGPRTDNTLTCTGLRPWRLEALLGPRACCAARCPAGSWPLPSTCARTLTSSPVGGGRAGSLQPDPGLCTVKGPPTRTAGFRDWPQRSLRGNNWF